MEFQKLSDNSKKGIEYYDIIKQLIGFTNKVLRMSQNGYEGYKIMVKQQNDEAVSMKDQLQVQEGEFRVIFEVEIEHLDWKSIKESESAETFEKYKQGLGIFILLMNKASRVTGIY